MTEHIYRGECRLKRWNDGSTTGRTITLEIDGEGPHPFRGYEGERFAVVIVPIGNDEKPMVKNTGEASSRASGREEARTEPRAPAPLEKRQEQAADHSLPSPTKPNSTRAVMMAKDVEFWDYLGSQSGVRRPTSPDEAEDTLKFLCGITSKKELNDRPKAAEAFERLRQDFYTYRNARQMGAA